MILKRFPYGIVPLFAKQQPVDCCTLHIVATGRIVILHARGGARGGLGGYSPRRSMLAPKFFCLFDILEHKYCVCGCHYPQYGYPIFK